MIEPTDYWKICSSKSKFSSFPPNVFFLGGYVKQVSLNKKNTHQKPTKTKPHCLHFCLISPNSNHQLQPPTSNHSPVVYAMRQGAKLYRPFSRRIWKWSRPRFLVVSTLWRYRYKRWVLDPVFVYIYIHICRAFVTTRARFIKGFLNLL